MEDWTKAGLPLSISILKSCAGVHVYMCIPAELSPRVERRSIIMSSMEEEVRELRAAVASLQNSVRFLNTGLLSLVYMTLCGICQSPDHNEC